MEQTAAIAIAPPAVSVRHAAPAEIIAHDLDQVAEALSVSRRTVNREIERGNLRAFRLGSRTLVAAEEIKRYVAVLTRASAA